MSREIGVAFGGWLVEQKEAAGWVGRLAAQAAGDPRFPRGGDPEALRQYLAAAGADGDTFEALEDAEALWRRSAGR